jgi:hypothetical protein
MIKNNFFGVLVIGGIVLLLLISSIQMFGWGTGISSIEVDTDNLTSIPTVPKSKTIEQTSSEDNKNTLEEIAMRPMFNADRSPYVEPPEAPDVEPPGEEIPEIKAQLTGVVITPEQSYAMILDTATNQRETYKVGMPLDGEQGGWTLNSIQSRKVTFVSDNDETVELELEVYSKQLKAGKQAGKNRPSNNKGSNSQKKSGEAIREEKKKNADDIRKKIAERRAQMRAEAAKKNK